MEGFGGGESASPQASPCRCSGSKGRNLVVCIDGTSKKFDKHKNTNVVELYSRLVKDKDQLTYYNSGIGTYAKPFWNSFGHWRRVVDKSIDRLIAWNFEKNLWAAYLWLVEHYQEGDRIFLFGYSRGAYQIRALAGMIEKVGLIHKGNKEQIPHAYAIYAADSDPPEGNAESPLNSKNDSTEAERFKQAFSRKNVNVHFIGAWDTVSSISPVHKLPGADSLGSTCFFRHALALDERRVKFAPEYAIPKGRKREDIGPSHSSPEGEAGHTQKSPRKPHIKEVWFPGSHSDIGGENVPYKANELDRRHPAFLWMSYEAMAAGLTLNAIGFDWYSNGLEGRRPSMRFWWLLEYLPFRRPTYNLLVNQDHIATEKNSSSLAGATATKRFTNKIHRGRSRKILPHQMIHISATFCRKEYVPRARMPDDSVNWSMIIGAANDGGSGRAKRQTNVGAALKLVMMGMVGVSPKGDWKRWDSSWLEKPLQRVIEVDCFEKTVAEEETIVTIIQYSEDIPQSVLETLEDKATKTNAFKHVENAASRLLQRMWARNPHTRIQIANAVTNFAEPKTFLETFQENGVAWNTKLRFLENFILTNGGGIHRPSPKKIEVIETLLTNSDNIKPDNIILTVAADALFDQQCVPCDATFRLFVKRFPDSSYARCKIAASGLIDTMLTKNDQCQPVYQTITALAKYEDSRKELLRGDLATKLRVSVDREMPSVVILEMLKAIAELAKHNDSHSSLLDNRVVDTFLTVLHSRNQKIRRSAYVIIEEWAKHSVSHSTLITTGIIQVVVADLVSKKSVKGLRGSAFNIVLEISKKYGMGRYGVKHKFGESELVAVWNSMVDNPRGPAASLVAQLSKHEFPREVMFKHEAGDSILNILTSQDENAHKSAYRIVKEWIIHDDSRRAMLDAGVTGVLLDHFKSKCQEDDLLKSPTTGEGFEGSQDADPWKGSDLGNIDYFSSDDKTYLLGSTITGILLALSEYDDSRSEMMKGINEGAGLIQILNTLLEGDAATRISALTIIAKLDKYGEIKDAIRTAGGRARGFDIFTSAVAKVVSKARIARYKNLTNLVTTRLLVEAPPFPGLLNWLLKCGLQVTILFFICHVLYFLLLLTSLEPRFIGHRGFASW